MRQIPTSTFKARCLAVMKTVQATGEPVIVTKRGSPVVKVVPIPTDKNDIFGFLTGKVKIIGDINRPSRSPGKSPKSDSPRYPRPCLGHRRTRKTFQACQFHHPQSHTHRRAGHLCNHSLGAGSCAQRMAVCSSPEPWRPTWKRFLLASPFGPSHQKSPRWPINSLQTIPTIHVIA